MKVFLSWSGPRSRAIAEALNDWLRRVIQAVRPFYSPEIEKGAKWSSEVDEALEGTRFGVICLTPDNLTSPWIHYEAGALAKTKDALIWTFLHGLAPADVPPPLGKFQHTVAEKGDVLLLLKTINGRLAEVGGEPLQDRLLEDNFELFWPMLEIKLKEAESKSAADPALKRGGTAENVRGEGAKLDEILELVRNQERRLGLVEESLTTSQALGRSNVLNNPERYYAVKVMVKSDEDEEAIAKKVAMLFSRYSEVEVSDVTINNTPRGTQVNVRFYLPILKRELETLVDVVSEKAGYVIGEWKAYKAN